MTAFDVAICLEQQSLNQALAPIYQRLCTDGSLFRGTKTADFAGIQATIEWDIPQAPQFSLNRGTADGLANNDIRPDGTVVAPHTGLFFMKLPALRIIRKPLSGPVQETVSAVDILCTAQIVDSAVVLTTLGLQVDLSHESPFEQAVYQVAIIPQVLASIGALLKEQPLPNIKLQGLFLDIPLWMIGNGRAIAVAYLYRTFEGLFGMYRGGGTPDPTALQPLLPLLPGECYVLLGDRALQSAVQTGVGVCTAASSVQITQPVRNGGTNTTEAQTGKTEEQPIIENAFQIKSAFQSY